MAASIADGLCDTSAHQAFGSSTQWFSLFRRIVEVFAPFVLRVKTRNSGSTVVAGGLILTVSDFLSASFCPSTKQVIKLVTCFSSTVGA